jgi:hypothetical protein
MSAPTEEPRNSTTTDVSHRASGPASPERQGRNNPLHSPYVPQWARTTPTPKPDSVRSGDTAPLAPLHAPEGLDDNSKMPMAQKRGDHSPRTAFEATAPPRDPGSAQPAHSSGQRRSAATHRDEIVSDLERLEASLLWVQREEAATRLTHAAPLPPVPGLASGGRRFDDSYRSPRSLEPERLASPDAMVLRRDRRHWPLIVLIAGILLTPIAYYFFIGGWIPPAAKGPQMASVEPIAVAPPTASKGQHQPAKDDSVGSSARSDTSSLITKTARTARSSEAGTVATLQQNETGIQEAPSKEPARALAPDEIKVLMKQGELFAEVGDLVTARLMFQRAAKAGDATAATALGATYDPTVLAKLGAVGISADLEKARFWYQSAASLGSSDAKRRLGLLANR